MKGRTERINLRVTAEEKARIEAAAEVSGKTVTSYILDEISSPEQRFVLGQYAREIAEAESPWELMRVMENAKKDGDITSNGLATLNQVAQGISNRFLRK